MITTANDQQYPLNSIRSRDGITRQSAFSSCVSRLFVAKAALSLSLFLFFAFFSNRIAKDVGESLQCRSIDLLFCNKRLSSVTLRRQTFTSFIRYFDCVSYCSDVCNENGSVNFEKKEKRSRLAQNSAKTKYEIFTNN